MAEITTETETPLEVIEQPTPKSRDFVPWEVASDWMALQDEIQKLERKLEKRRGERDKMENDHPFLGQIKGIIKKETKKPFVPSKSPSVGKKRERETGPPQVTTQSQQSQKKKPARQNIVANLGKQVEKNKIPRNLDFQRSTGDRDNFMMSLDKK